MQEVSGLLLKLTLATRQWHADVDDPWLGLLRPTVTAADYRAQLVRMYGLVAPFESACRYTRGIETLVNVHELTRAGLIAQDLLALGMSPSQVASIPTCPALTAFRGIPEAIAWLYVVERSMLLQDGIRRHLVHHLPHVEDACTYLEAYDGRVDEPWRNLAGLLDRITLEHHEAEIAQAAEAAFRTTRQWFRSAPGTTRSAL